MLIKSTEYFAIMFYELYINNKYYAQPGTQSLPLRSEIEEIYKWDLSHIYSSEDLWEKEFKWIEQEINNYKNFEGTLSKSAENLLLCFL